MKLTDCRSPEGITVGLVDSLISISRVLAPRLRESFYTPAIKEALMDLRSDEDMNLVLGRGADVGQRRDVS